MNENPIISWETTLVEVGSYKLIGFTTKKWWEEPETTIIQDNQKSFEHFKPEDKIRINLSIENQNYLDNKDSFVGVVHEIMENCVILKTYTGRPTLYRYERTLTRGLLINNYDRLRIFEIGDVLRVWIQKIW